MRRFWLHQANARMNQMILKLAFGKTPDQVEAELMGVIPEPYLVRAHHWLILHGRYVCTARKPKCDECPVADLCPSRALFT